MGDHPDCSSYGNLATTTTTTTPTTTTTTTTSRLYASSAWSNGYNWYCPENHTACSSDSHVARHHISRKHAKAVAAGTACAVTWAGIGAEFGTLSIGPLGLVPGAVVAAVGGSVGCAMVGGTTYVAYSERDACFHQCSEHV